MQDINKITTDTLLNFWGKFIDEWSGNYDEWKEKNAELLEAFDSDLHAEDKSPLNVMREHFIGGFNAGMTFTILLQLVGKEGDADFMHRVHTLLKETVNE